jgi:hypothetical protein
MATEPLVERPGSFNAAATVYASNPGPSFKLAQSDSDFPETNYTATVNIEFLSPDKTADSRKINTNYNSGVGDSNTIGYVTNATFTKIVNGIGNFKISIADPSWKNTEEAILWSRGKCKINYGYLEDKTARTQPIDAFIVNYELEFDIGRVIVHASGLLLGYEVSTFKNWTLPKESRQIGEILKDIAKLCELDAENGLMEPLDNSPLDFNDIETSNGGPLKLGNSSGETPLQVITQKLARYAKNTEGKGGFVFYITTTKKDGSPLDGGTKGVLNFCTPDYKEKNQTTQVYKEYNIFGTVGSKILDYKPSWNATLVDITGGAGIVNEQFNKFTGEILSLKDTEAQNISGIKDEERDKLTVTAGVPGSEAAANNAITSTRAFALMSPLSAEALLIGDPLFNVLDLVLIRVYMPHHAGFDEGDLHKMSGMYMVKQVVDNINLGKYTTQLSLMVAPSIYRLMQDANGESRSGESSVIHPDPAGITNQYSNPPRARGTFGAYNSGQ